MPSEYLIIEEDSEKREVIRLSSLLKSILAKGYNKNTVLM